MTSLPALRPRTMPLPAQAMMTRFSCSGTSVTLGKPCVSGIQDITSMFTDGQVVEVDGGAGLIRFMG